MSDVGKNAKRMGRPLARDIRKLSLSVAKPPAGVPPHEYEKKRRYLLTVVETTISVHRETHCYRSKEEREQGRAKMERESKRWNGNYSWSRCGFEVHAHSTSTREYEYSEDFGAEPVKEGKRK